MSAITKYEIATTVLQPFVYERDYMGGELPAIDDPESTVEAAELADDVPHWTDETQDEVVGAAVRGLLVAILEAVPADRALDTSYVSYGRRIPSWRDRLVLDYRQAIEWQIGHSAEAETLAADELIGALRAHVNDELSRRRLEDAETRVRQAERRVTLWGLAHAAVKDFGYYPLPAMASADWIGLQIRDGIRGFQNLLGEPARSFIAHRMLWAIGRFLRRGIVDAHERLEKHGHNRQASRDIRTQIRAYELIEAEICTAYELAGEGSMAQRSRTSQEKVRAVTAGWLEANKKRARAFAA